MSDDKIYRDIERLRDPHRLARLETERVISLSLQGHQINRVLDIGTGSGVFAEVFARRGLAVTGIDLQEPMLEAPLGKHLRLFRNSDDSVETLGPFFTG
jgi:2-polyprenyl-3-methyl-5-hydroxy-6-metoxy-1,4-benzoquinol methylase